MMKVHSTELDTAVIHMMGTKATPYLKAEFGHYRVLIWVYTLLSYSVRS